MIEFQHVYKTYKKGVPALEDVNFKIDAGEFVFFIGESGAGKSTLIKLLTCEERPTRGRVILDHFNVGRMRRQLVPFLRRRFGMVFQDFRLIDSKTVFENVAFAMEIVGAPQDVIQRRVPIVLSVVGLKERMDAYPSELSGGEAQRVGIARAMVNNPRLILADEPTGNLDPANSEAIMALLEEVNRVGTTVIICTHDVALVDAMRKRVIELKDGRIVRDEKSSGYEHGSCYLPTPEEMAELDRLIETADPKAAAEDRRYQREVAAESEELDSYAEMGRIKDKLLEDQERRRNRESLAERIARMRLEVEGNYGREAAELTPEEREARKEAMLRHPMLQLDKDKDRQAEEETAEKEDADHETL